LNPAARRQRRPASLPRLRRQSTFQDQECQRNKTASARKWQGQEAALQATDPGQDWFSSTITLASLQFYRQTHTELTFAS
jgi:hypothetical protein